MVVHMIHRRMGYDKSLNYRLATRDEAASGVEERELVTPVKFQSRNDLLKIMAAFRIVSYTHRTTRYAIIKHLGL